MGDAPTITRDQLISTTGDEISDLTLEHRRRDLGMLNGEETPESTALLLFRQLDKISLACSSQELKGLPVHTQVT